MATFNKALHSRFLDTCSITFFDDGAAVLRHLAPPHRGTQLSAQDVKLLHAALDCQLREVKPRSGKCVECERESVQLSPQGYCEGCVMQAAIDAMEPEERWK